MTTTTDPVAHDLAWALGRIAQEKDLQAWSILVNRVGPDIQRLATRLIGDFALAEDAVQETFLLIRDHADRFAVRTQDADSDARRWILGVASHVSFHLLRHHQRQKLRAYHFGQAVEQMKAPMSDPASQAEHADDAQLLRRELAELPAIYGQVLTLHYFADQDYPQLASHLRVSINTVRSRVNRGLKVLRERLDRCGVTLSIVALTGLLSNLGAAPVTVVALPTSTLGIISSNTVATTTLPMTGTSLVTAGTVIITAILTTMLAATFTLIGWSLDWFNAAAASSIPMIENRAPLPQVNPGADVKARVAPFIMVIKTDQQAGPNNNISNFDLSFMPSGPNQFTLPLRMDYSYDFTINWGDGTNEIITRTFPKELAKHFDQEVTVDFTEVNLVDAITSLNQTTPLTIVLDPTAIKQLQKELEWPLGWHIEKEILRSILLKIANTFNLKSTYSEKENAIVFTTGKGANDAQFPTHTYAKAGTYNVEITENVIGGFPAIFYNQRFDCHKVMAISQWGGNTWICLSQAFAGCDNLTITASDAQTALTGSVANFNNAWFGCSGLTNFPLLNTAAGTDFSSAWAGCSGLTNFPLLNTAAGTDFSSAWAGCSGLTSFPLLKTAAGSDFYGAWSACSGLTSFPLLNTAAGTNFSHAWRACSGLTSFPLLNTAAGTDFYATWSSCSGLTSFPLLNTAAGTDFTATWFDCSGLTSFPLLNTAAGTDFSWAWRNCSSLTSFPLLNTAAGTEFSSAWAGCSGLTSFPFLDTAAGSDFHGAWSVCSGLTSFPLLNTAAGTNFSYAWSNCSSLTSFPLLNTAAGTNFSNAWSNCSGLTSFPLLNTAAGTSFSAAWFSCTGLTSFPLLNTAAGTGFGWAWMNCTGLTSFPLLNTAAGTGFDSAWAGCKNLKFIPTLNFGNMASGQNCFAGVSLDPDSYSDLLMNIANLNLTQKVTFDGGLSKMNAKALAARKILTTDRGWTIYDAETPKPINENNGKKAGEVAPPPKPQEVNDF